MTMISLPVIALAIASASFVACSSGGDGSPGSSGTDGGSADSGSGDAAPLSADCQRLYDCCVGPAAQTPKFCTGLAAGGSCGTWLGSYAQAGIQCN